MKRELFHTNMFQVMMILTAIKEEEKRPRNIPSEYKHKFGTYTCINHVTVHCMSSVLLFYYINIFLYQTTFRMLLISLGCKGQYKYLFILSYLCSLSSILASYTVIFRNAMAFVGRVILHFQKSYCTGCSLGIGDRRILCLLRIILRLFPERALLFHNNFPATLHYSPATTILNETPDCRGGYFYIRM